MRTVSIRLEDLAKMAIKIGFVGENEHTRVCIDCKKAFDEYPGAVATLTVQPPAGEAYPDVTTRDGDTVIWNVEDHDLTDEGDGEFQLSFVVDETVMKSYIGRTTICRSILPAGDVPAAIDDWLTRANAALAEIPVEIAAALQAAKDSGEFDGRGISGAVLNSDYSLTLTFTDGTSYTTPSIRGEKGKDFTIAKTFSSTAQMEEYTGTDIEAGDFVMINTGDTEDADNGKLFCYMPGVNILNTSTMTADVSPNKNYIFSATLTVTSGTYQDVTIWHTVTQGLGKVEEELSYFNIGTTFNERINITTEQYDIGLRFTFSHLSVSNVTLTEKWGYICDLSGPQGEQGIQGEEGEPGVSPTASVTKSGDTATITITDKNGTTTAQVTDGATGETGASPVFSIGTVTTGDAGTNAAVTQSGTDLAPVLNFTIPKGAKGDAGNGDMLAPAFAEGTANAAGTYVTYNGGLYLLPNGHTANTTWANTSKTSVTVGGQLSDQKSALDDVTEQTRNIWKWGDQTVTGQKYVFNLTDSIPAGTYTLSAMIEKTGNAGNVRIVFYKNSISTSNRLAEPYIYSGSRGSTTFTLAEAANIVIVYSGLASTSTATATWKDVQLEAGTTAHPYIPYDTATDFVAREDIDNLEEEVETVETDINDKWDNIKDALGTHDEYEEITVPAGTGYGNGKYWNCETTTATLASSGNYYAFKPYPVTEGDKFQIHIYPGDSSKQRSILVVNSSMTILQSYQGRTGAYRYYEITIPENGAFLLLTTYKDYMENYYTKKAFAVLNEVSSGFAGGMDFNGKNVAIIGDSISTNGAYSDSNPFGNVPEIIISQADVTAGITLKAYVTYYDIGTTINGNVTIDGVTTTGHTIASDDVGKEISITPVSGDIGTYIGVPVSYNPASRKVWWEVMQDAMGFNPIPVCWSGASVSSHEGNDAEYKTSYAWHDAQIRKCGIRTPGTTGFDAETGEINRTPPDVVIIYRGTNDMTHSPYARLTAGYFDNYNWQYPESDIVDTNKYGYKEALCLTIKKLRDTYPNAKIFLCTLNVFKRVNYSHFPTNNGLYSLPQMNDAIREVADFMGCGLIEFDKDGITFENCYSEGYITDSATVPTHPSNKGHKVMGNKAMLDIGAQCNSMS